MLLSQLKEGQIFKLPQDGSLCYKVLGVNGSFTNCNILTDRLAGTPFNPKSLNVDSPVEVLPTLSTLNVGSKFYLHGYLHEIVEVHEGDIYECSVSGINDGHTNLRGNTQVVLAY